MTRIIFSWDFLQINERSEQPKAARSLVYTDSRVTTSTVFESNVYLSFSSLCTDIYATITQICFFTTSTQSIEIFFFNIHIRCFKLISGHHSRIYTSANFQKTFFVQGNRGTSVFLLQHFFFSHPSWKIPINLPIQLRHLISNQFFPNLEDYRVIFFEHSQFSRDIVSNLRCLCAPHLDKLFYTPQEILHPGE